MENKKNIIAIRHTPVVVPNNICYGRLELNLKDSFEDDAKVVLENIKKYIQKNQSYSLYSSPSKRCIQLAFYLLNYFHLSLKVDERIWEFSYGDWEGLSWDTIDPKELEIWSNDFMNYSPPKGENFRSFTYRIDSFIQEIYQKEEVPILITHSGVIRGLFYLYLNIPQEKIFSLSIPYGAIFQFFIP